MAVVLLVLAVVRLLHLLPCFFLLLFTSISLKEEPTTNLVLCAQNFTNLQTKNRTPKNSHYFKRRKEIRKSSRRPRGSKPQTTLPPHPHKHLYQRDSKGKNRKQIEKLVYKNEQNSLLRSETRVAIIRRPALLSKVLSSSLKKKLSYAATTRESRVVFRVRYACVILQPKTHLEAKKLKSECEDMEKGNKSKSRQLSLLKNERYHTIHTYIRDPEESLTQFLL